MTMTHQEGVRHVHAWMTARTGFALHEFSASTPLGEIPDVIGFRQAPFYSVLAEVKVTRADFLADKRKPHRQHGTLGAGRFRYYACPEHLISREELPEQWGLLYIKPTGQVRIVVNAEKLGYVWDIDGDAEYALMYGALRRINLRGQLGSIYESAAAALGPKRSRPRVGRN